MKLVDKIRTLGGWARLWIFVSLLWLVLVTFFAAGIFPNERIAHTESLYEDMDPEAQDALSRLRLAVHDVENPYRDVNSSRETVRREAVRRGLIIVREAGNRAHLVFTPPEGADVDDPKFVADVETITTSYERILRRLRRQQRIGFVGKAVAVWLVPCLIVFVLGRSAGWVYQGFTKELVQPGEPHGDGEETG